jgi:hypothetical protein
MASQLGKSLVVGGRLGRDLSEGAEYSLPFDVNKCPPRVQTGNP